MATLVVWDGSRPVFQSANSLSSHCFVVAVVAVSNGAATDSNLHDQLQLGTSKIEYCEECVCVRERERKRGRD